MNSHEVFIHIHQGCVAGTGAIVRLPQCQWSKPDVYGKISQCITTTKHSKAKTVCIFLGIYCMCRASYLLYRVPRISVDLCCFGLLIFIQIIYDLIDAWIMRGFSRPTIQWAFNSLLFSIKHTTSWWRHQMEIFSALLAICARKSPVTGGFRSQRPETRSFDVFCRLCMNKWLSKQSQGWWVETPSCSCWRHRNVTQRCYCARKYIPTGTDQNIRGRYLMLAGYSILEIGHSNAQCPRWNIQLTSWYSSRYWFLTHWGRVTHICLDKLTIIGSDNGLSPGRRQAIIWTNAGILLIGPLGTNFIEILVGIQTFSFKKMHLKMSSAKWRPFCLGLNVLREGDSAVVTLRCKRIGNSNNFIEIVVMQWYRIVTDERADAHGGRFGWFPSTWSQKRNSDEMYA